MCSPISAGRLPGNAITVATHLQKLRSLVDAACTAVVSDLEPGERKALWWDTQGRPLPPGVSPNDEAAD